MEIAGHKKTRKTLSALARKKLLPQSFLFSGPRALGKKLVALEFAGELVGLRNGDPLAHPDILLLSPAREEEKGKIKKKRIPVEEVRKATLFLSRYPTVGERRVLIIDEAEELSTEASNALLKLLEEPNETSILILVTHRPGALLPTVLSRVVSFPFDLVPSTELHAFFGETKKRLPDFFFSLGLPGLITSALHEEELFASHKDSLGNLFQISKLSIRERLKLAEKLSLDEDELALLLDEWLAGMHGRLTATKDPAEAKKLLLLFDRLSKQIVSLTRREGNSRLLLEEMFLAF